MKRLFPVLLFLCFFAGCDNGTTGKTDLDTVAPDDEADMTGDTGESDGEDALLEDATTDEDDIPFDGDFERVVVTPKSGIELAATVDLRSWEQGLFRVTENLSFPAPADGNTVKLFGEKMTIEKASFPYEYDKHTAFFFPGEFSKGDSITIEAIFSFHPPSSMGMQVWEDPGTGETVIGPFTEPYFTAYWLIVPQSPFKTDKDNDANVPVEKVRLTVITPGEEWQVMGPGVTGAREGNAWTFSMDHPMPFYALSFAASPDYTFFSAGKTASGIEIVGAGFANEIENLKMIYPAGVTTVEWMEKYIGSYAFGGKVGLASIPNFGGGMEHVGVIYMGTDVLDSYESGVFVTVHEIVHNWWGNNVRFADWPDFWVAEGFDEWTTNYNLMAAIEDATSFTNRKNQYRTVAAFLCSAADAVPLRFSPDLDFMTLDIQMQTAYYYGAAFLEMVNKRLSRDFDGMELLPLLKLWFEEKQKSTVTTEDFLDFLVAHTSGEADATDYWQTLFDDWVYRAPCPTLIASDYAFSEGTFSFRLYHAGNAPDLPGLPVIIVWGDDSVTATTVDLAAKGAVVVTLDGPSAPKRILIDPEWFYVFALDTTEWKGPGVEFFSR